MSHKERTYTVRGRESVPVDRTAARVVRPGIEFKPTDKKLGQELWEVPPPTLRPPDGCDDLTGTRRGRMTIVGYLDSAGGKKGSRWLARCDCGKYERRAGPKWRKGLRDERPDHGCQHCQYLNYLKRNDKYRREGRNYDSTAAR